MKIGYLYLGIAIVAEVVATSALKASEGFNRTLGPASSSPSVTASPSTSCRWS